MTLYKECTNPRGQEDSRLVAILAQDEAIAPVRSTAITYLCGELGMNVHVLSNEDRSIMVWVLVCLGETQDARQIIRPDYQEQKRRMKPQFSKLLLNSLHFRTSSGDKSPATIRAKMIADFTVAFVLIDEIRYNRSFMRMFFFEFNKP